MRNYLSFGGGVNSTAMLLLLTDEKWKFETIYVDHECDWPETREYVQMIKRYFPVTILSPSVEGFSNLYEYADKYKMIPSRKKRWCTDKFKVRVINQYVKKPCFSLIGFSSDESHRAKLSTEKGIENRFPLLEYEIDRNECIHIIKKFGFPVPIKSGCYFCPFQRIKQWKKLRKIHPELFCKAKKLEDQEIKARAKIGKGPLYLNKRPLEKVVNENQAEIWEDLRPPCECML